MKVKSLATLRQAATDFDVTTPINALKYFNRLVLFAQRESNLESSLGEYELTPLPLSLFSEKDQLMREGDKANFAQTCLKEKSEQVTNKAMIDSLVVDGGWLLRQNAWEKGDEWIAIINGYSTLVKSLGYSAIHILVVFDGYENSTKDHAHRRRKKLFCHDMKITLHNTPYATKEKFLSNGNNKTELISHLKEAFEKVNIDTICCTNDADTSIVRSCLENSITGRVELRGEDADLLVLLIHHFDDTKHNDIIFTTSKGSYSLKI